MDKIFNLKIDSKVGNINVVQGLKQYDNNSVLNITLLQNCLALDLTNCTVRLNFLREDKRVLIYMADIVSAREGKVSIKLSPEVLEKVGTIQCDISVFDSNLLKITSATFKLRVEKSIYSNDYYLNTKDFDIVQKMHIEEEARIKNEKARIESENTRTTDEKKRSDAESLRSEKENERISNEEKRVQSESKRNEDEQIRIEAEDKRKEYEKNRLDQEKIRIENEKTRVEAEDKRKISENTRVDNELGRITYEGQREANEKVRIQSELNRVAKEDKRTESEEKRLEAEKLRIENESERINSEITRVTAEQKRVTNETNRIDSEKTRVEEWNKIKDTFNNKAPGDMKTIVYDKNGNGKVDVAEFAESIEWENVKNKPNLDDIGKVKSINSKTGDVILKASDIKTEKGTNLEKLSSQYEEMTQEIASLQQTDFYIDEKNGSDTNDGTENNPVKTSKKIFQLIKKCSNRPNLHLLSDITNDNHFDFENISLIINGNNHVIYGNDNEGIGLVFCDCYVKNIELKNCRFYVQHSNIHIENFKHNKSRSNMFYNSNIKIFNCSFENPTYWSMTIDKNSNFQGHDLNFSNCESCISIMGNSYASLYNCSFKNITQSNIITSRGGICDIRE